MILHLQATETYRYLWLKSVTGVDLSQHCARSLKGPYCKGISARGGRTQSVELHPTPGLIAWYLCGVTQHPYRWHDNPHLPLVPAPGAEGTIMLAGGMTVTYQDAHPVDFSEEDIPPDAEHRLDRAYRTCRNWQFAHHAHQHLIGGAQ